MAELLASAEIKANGLVNHLQIHDNDGRLFCVEATDTGFILLQLEPDTTTKRVAVKHLTTHAFGKYTSIESILTTLDHGGAHIAQMCGSLIATVGDGKHMSSSVRYLQVFQYNEYGYKVPPCEIDNM